MDAFSHFRLTDRESCEAAIRRGGYATLVSVAATTFLAISTNAWLMVDVALMLVVTVLIFRKSRAAATFMVINFFASKCLLWAELGQPKGLGLAVILFLYYLTATRAAFRWHSLYRDQEENVEMVEEVA